MNKPITATIKAWFTHSLSGPGDLKREPSDLMGALGFTNADMSQYGWTYMGDAQIKLMPLPADDMVASKVQSLRTKRELVVATAERDANLIDQQIQSLLAITNETGPTT